MHIISLIWLIWRPSCIPPRELNLNLNLNFQLICERRWFKAWLNHVIEKVYTHCGSRRRKSDSSDLAIRTARAVIMRIILPGICTGQVTTLLIFYKITFSHKSLTFAGKWDFEKVTLVRDLSIPCVTTAYQNKTPLHPLLAWRDLRRTPLLGAYPQSASNGQLRSRKGRCVLIFCWIFYFLTL